MAFDEALAQGVRERLTGIDYTEQRMFGGLAFSWAGTWPSPSSGPPREVG